jgi:glycosyltransferase involved in cell wall biosynthesis
VRILQIAKYFHPDEGGIETVTRALSEGLAQAGHRADILCFARNRLYAPSDFPWQVIRARTSLRIGDKPLSLDYALRVRALSDAYDVGLVHTPNPIGLAAVLAFWRKPLVILWHSDVLTMPALSAALRPLEAAALRKSAAVAVPARAHIEGSNMRALIEPKAHVIPFPFDVAWLPRSNGPSLAMDRVRVFARGRKLVLAVGRLVPYKGYDVLIDAARALSPDLAVCIAGGGPEAGTLTRRIVEGGLGDRVLLLGRVPASDLRALYEAASIVTMPSVTRQEMYGLTQVESLAFGKPIVSTRIPFSAVPEVNIDGVTGMIVEPANAGALADALNRIGADGAMSARMEIAARDRFLEQHQVRDFGLRYARLLESVAG